MNPDTGAIAEFESDEDAKAAGYTVPLKGELAERLRKVPREERLSLLKTLAPFHPLAQLAGLTADDVRKLRNRAKRARRAHRG